ncbi:hypothetical protein B5M42_001790 [Paenibacillus athensensis]|uniref:hypothetical protein n=1 Tax=Paenibacillus athensensis TaxID=1967502 RepID=UPI00143222ED|nr:hypothetical protein [Paenibacillus athensensis]MCD1257568.1 hypothetical protein [Paenibacillus athensensis]
MGVFTFLSLLVIGSIFSTGCLLFFKRKPAFGAVFVLLSVACYIAYVVIATRYFA